ncbi:MAG TPA: hypothetical protein VNM37_03505, partial [Candidatus Dormibacteraeota bacterium]|nr:hypothetical protein [Candidatus Dormibacteraeota bacterium]
SNAQLEDDYPQIPGTVPAFFPPYELRPHQDLESTLHQVLLLPSTIMNRAVSGASNPYGQARATRAISRRDQAMPSGSLTPSSATGSRAAAPKFNSGC